MKLYKHPVSGYLVNRDGSYIENPETGYVLNPTLAPSGYLKIGNYICSSGTVHQLVYEAVSGSLVPKGLCINHKDGVKTNNDCDNLEVVTNRENTIHAYENGLAKGKKGETNSQAKLTDDDYDNIVIMLESGACNSCIGDKFKVSSGYVSLIRSGRRWSFKNKTFPKSNKWKCPICTATTIESTR